MCTGIIFTKGFTMARHVYVRGTREYYPGNKPNIVYFYENDKKKKVQARIAAFKGKKMVVYKKALQIADASNAWAREYCLITLEIPARAERLQPKNYKCRASHAKVLAIHKMDWHCGKKVEQINTAYAKHDRLFIYEVGKTVKPRNKFDKNHRQECRSGIHFFLTEQEAMDYDL